MTTPSSIPTDVYITGSTGQTKIHDFNPGRKSWQIYAHKISTIGDNLILEATGTNSEIYFKQKDNQVYKITDLLGGGSSYNDAQPINIGYNAGLSNPANYSIAMGNEAGETDNLPYSIAIGYQANKTSFPGYNNEGAYNIAIGYQAAGLVPSSTVNANELNKNNISIGYQAGYETKYYNTVSIGTQCGYQNQESSAIAIGYLSGKINQGTGCIAIGQEAGQTDQGVFSSIAIGTYAGKQNQGNYSVCIGRDAANEDQSDYAIAIGYLSGKKTQGENSISLGRNAGKETQGTYSIAIGMQAGENSQEANSIAIGYNAGRQNQKGNSVAIGHDTASGQKFNSVALGSMCGWNQDHGSVAIGRSAGLYQSNYAVAIGEGAGGHWQGSYTVAIGRRAAPTSQHSESIVINARNGDLNTTQGGSLFIKPIRPSSNNNKLLYNSGTGEITYEPDTTTAISGVAHLSTEGTIAMFSHTNFDTVQNAAIYQQANGNTIVNAKPTGNLYFNLGTGHTNNTKMVIKGGTISDPSYGFVGIGMGGNPTLDEMLHVAGNIKTNGNLEVNGNIKAGGILGDANNSVYIGNSSGSLNPDSVQGNNIAIGSYAGYQNQAVDVNYPQYAGKSIAIGYYAAKTDQAERSIAIGSHAAENNQGGWSIAIGEEAGQTNQGSNACGIGWRAGYNQQGAYAVAIGDGAGVQSQGNFSVAIGQAAGRDNQGIESVAIGRSSCLSGQGNYAVAIGRNSGAGTNSVGIGAYSGAGNERSIVLNATGSTLNSGSSDALFIKPIRSDTNSNKLLYNSSSGEITYQPDGLGQINATGYQHEIISTQEQYGLILTKDSHNLIRLAGSKGAGLLIHGEGSNVNSYGGSIAITGSQINQGGPGPYIEFLSSRSTYNQLASDTYTAVGDGDILGYFRWNGDNGINCRASTAEISCQVDGTVTNNKVPGAIRFTTHNGTHYSERMRINGNGDLQINQKLEVGGNVLAEGTIGNTVTGINGISNYNLWNVNSTLITELKNFISTYGQRYNADGSENWGSSVKFTVNTSLTENGGIALWNETFKLNADAEYGISLRTGIGNPVERLKVHNNGNVGIGTSSPGEKLEVDGNIKATGTLEAHANSNDASAVSQIGNAKIGANTWSNYVSFSHKNFHTSSGYGLRLGHDGNTAVNAGGSSGIHLKLNDQIAMIIKTVNNSRNVGIGTSTPGEKLEVDGNIKSSGSFLGSDDRLKHNEEDIVGALSVMRKLKPQKYQKTKELKAADFNGSLDEDEILGVEAGFIAQDIQNIAELDYSVTGGDFIEETTDLSGIVTSNTVSKPYYLNYNNILTYNVAATQELDTIVSSLLAEIASLKERISALEN